MARAHDGLMMLLMVGRNHALRLVVFYDVISFMMDECIMYVISFIYIIVLYIMDSRMLMYLYFYICIFF